MTARRDPPELEPLFSPSRAAVAGAQLTDFASFCARSTGRELSSARALHAFSVEDARAFWALFLEWSALATEGSAEPVRVGDEVETARFFPNLRLSYVENLLRTRPGFGDDDPAVTACDERGRVLRWTRGELRDRVLAAAHALRGLGLAKGDRVVAVASNTAETIVACLATLALGATWSSIAPDVGAPAVLARFAPLAPKLMFVHTSFLDRGERRDTAERVASIAGALPSLETVVALRDEPLPEGVSPAHAKLSDLMRSAQTSRRLDELERFPFDHPLFILFSSGTTGRPKCLVHGAGGTLLEHHKEHRLHCDFGPKDKLYFHTTCSWMMWNWLLSALACGTEIVVYEGAIAYPQPDSLWNLVARERVTVFGTSPAFLQFSRDARIRPRATHDLDALRAIQSTGSVLKDALFEWIRDEVKTALPVQSISGGTDIIGCFFLGHPWLPVYAGELQAPSLGLDVRALGQKDGRFGELVCANPFPSRPIGIHGDDSGQRFHDTYFAQNPGYWTHGDLIEITPRGTARVHGRTDGVMNVGGVRIGPAEIYAALEDVDELAATMAIEQRCAAAPGGSRIVLFVVLRSGFALTKELQARIRRELERKCSRAHVPAVVVELDELPETHNFKRAERAARDAANGDPVANIEALRNPRVLDVIRAHPALATLVYAAAPRGEIEEQLGAIWSQVLGVADVAVDDNFFELGGQSLNAVLLCTAMRDKFDVEFTISTFLHAPTITRCAAVIREASATQPRSFRALVQIKDGVGVPFFCVHGAGGNVLNFRDLSLALPADRPFYGLQAHGVDGITPLLPSIEAMAQAYLTEVREARPHGPYLLGGYSGGGVVAFEMARRLTADGEDVALLSLFDTRHPQGRVREPTFAERVARLRDERFEYVREIAHRRMTGVRQMRERRELDRCLRAGARIPYALRDLHLTSTFIEAQERYVPGTWPGRAALFRAETVEHVYRGAGPAYGWEKHVGDLDVVVVPGGHHTLVLGSNARILAKSLEAAIEAALDRVPLINPHSNPSLKSPSTPATGPSS